MQLHPILLLSVIIGIELSRGHHIQIDSNEVDIISLGNSKRETGNAPQNGLKKSYSGWAPWSVCLGGRKNRRRHCLNRRICGDSLRIEVASCSKSRHNYRQNTQENLKSSENIHKQHVIIQNLSVRGKMHSDEGNPWGGPTNNSLPPGNIASELRQLNAKDVQKKFRGFSPWTTWTSCSRKCTTVRKRHCLKPHICGKQVIRQSAYCYLEGSYCQLWIRNKMQRRKDPEHTKDESKAMPQPVPAIHPEDSRTLSKARIPLCGRIGRYRSANARVRAKMRDMVRIIGGRPAPPGKWIWQVVVLNRYKEAFCGGTLIALRWVVTAAHCVRKRLYVRLGEHDLLVHSYGEIEMRVTEAVIHPQYDPDTVVNDVALLRLPIAARPDLGHGIACLPKPHQILPPHSTCTILGWGKKRPTDVHGTRILHEAQVSTIQQGVCRRSYWQYAITDNMVCAGRGNRDSCAGDSGGPLLCRDRNMRYTLQGITSFGDGCGKRGKYGIYTRTAGYVTWMRDIMNNKYFDD